ncbi:DUF2232 domain-containing protein [Arenibaculum sp.]|jgi:uncharacterized protein YybS (DUF2232 family)|uniref:DUF2232 domain-containing protein n=1 Tax=Arenibaculum sp. TaxID=2865862 RepID=UPI002E0D7547|nr:DUF2232 domain-containing protein [Arenibaculum sp.]
MGQLLLAAGGGVVSAAMYLSVIAGGLGALILAYLAPLPLLLAGLGIGTAAVLAGGATALVTVAVVADPIVAAVFGLATLLPAFVVSRQALLARAAADGTLEWYPPGRLVMALAWLGVVLVVVAALAAADHPGGLQVWLERQLSASLGGFVEEADPAGGDGAGIVVPLSRVLPAIVVASWITMIVANAALAQGLLMRLGRNRRPAMRMADLSLPPSALAGPAVAGFLALVLPEPTDYVALNAALVLAVPFFFAGLAVVHAFAQARNARPIVLVAFYGFLVLIQWMVPLVICLGVVEQWAGLRRRLMRAGPSEEDV